MRTATHRDTEITQRFDNKKILRAAHLFGSFFASAAHQKCEEEAISAAETLRGAEIAAHQKDVRAFLCGVYGNPAYGSWPAEAAKYQRELLAHRGVFLEGTHCSHCGTNVDRWRKVEGLDVCVPCWRHAMTLAKDRCSICGTHLDGDTLVCAACALEATRDECADQRYRELVEHGAAGERGSTPAPSAADAS